MVNIICALIAYLLGSIETSVILSKLFKFPDPRTHGSGNSGATNVLRTAGKNQALLTLIGDMLKGFLAVLIALVFGVNGFFLAFILLAAVIGHIFPIFFQFRGGKGVATAIGGLLLLSFWTAIIAAIIWIATVIITRYISLASLIAIVASPILILIISQSAYFIPILIMAGLIIWKHKENIERLRAGIEHKVNLKL